MTENLSPQLNNFVFLLAAFFLFVWIVRVFYRSRSLYDLKQALQIRSIVRLDGLSSSIRQVGPISRHHLQQILTARSRYTTSVIAPVRLPVTAHSKSFKITNANDPTTGQPTLTLHFKLTCSSPVIAEVYYGLKYSAIQLLFSSRYDKPAKKPKKQNSVSGSTLPGAVGSADGVEMDVLRDRPPQSISFSADQFIFKVCTPVIPVCKDQEVEIALDTRWLINAVSQAKRCYPLSLLLRECPSDQEHEEHKSDGLRKRLSRSSPAPPAPSPACQLTMLLFTGTESAKSPKAADSGPSGPEILPPLTPSPPQHAPPGADPAERKQEPEAADAPAVEEPLSPSPEPELAPGPRFRAEQPESPTNAGDEESEAHHVRSPTAEELENARTLEGLRSLNSTIAANRRGSDGRERKMQSTARATSPRADDDSGFVPIVKVDSQLLLTDRELLELQEVYGLDDPENMECTVCLTEPKDIIPLPCRHCCICHVCFENIRGKCPVCRSQILSFMKFSGTDKDKSKPYVPPTLNPDAGRDGNQHGMARQMGRMGGM